ncbi:ribosome-assembly protein 3 domain-containing protein [Trichoderma austrokoningii]
MPQDSPQSQQASFSALYLQRATQELSEDLDKIRNADDFKVESVPFLVHVLQQGAQQFSASQQKAVLKNSESRQG